MFYSTQILGRKGPLGLVWMAANMDRGLKRSQVHDTSIPDTVDVLLSPETPLALRLRGQLLLGVCRIYSRKVVFLFQDCRDALVKVRLACRPEQIAALTRAAAGAKGGRRRGGAGAADANAPAHALPLETITLPDDLDELQILTGDNFDLRAFQPAMALEAMMAELQQQQSQSVRRRMGATFGGGDLSESEFQDGYSMGLTTHFSSGIGGAGVSGDMEMEVFEDAGAPFEFDLEENEIERFRAAPAVEASARGAASVAALFGGEPNAVRDDDGDGVTGSGSPSSGLAKPESAGMSIERRRSTAAAPDVHVGGGGRNMEAAGLGELLPDLGLDAENLDMDLGPSEEHHGDDDGGGNAAAGAKTPSASATRQPGFSAGTAGGAKTPGASGVRQPDASTGGTAEDAVRQPGADSAGGPADSALRQPGASTAAAAGADAAMTSSLYTQGDAKGEGPSSTVSFTAEEVRAAVEAMDHADGAADAYDMPPLGAGARIGEHNGDDAPEGAPALDADGDAIMADEAGDAALEDAAAAATAGAGPTGPVPAETGAGAGAGAGTEENIGPQDLGAVEEKQPSPPPPQGKTVTARRRAAQKAGMQRAVTFDKEGTTIPVSRMRVWLQDRSELLDPARWLGHRGLNAPMQPPAAAAAAAQQLRRLRRRGASKRQCISDYDPVHVRALVAAATGEVEGLLNSTAPAAVGSRPLAISVTMAVAAGPSVASAAAAGVAAAAAARGRRVGRGRSAAPPQTSTSTTFAPTLQALFNVALGRMAPQYALQMGAFAAAGAAGLRHVPSGVGADLDAALMGAGFGGAAPFAAAAIVPGLAGAGTPATSAGEAEAWAGLAPAPNANAPGFSNPDGARTAPGTPSQQGQGATLSSQGLGGGRGSADAAMAPLPGRSSRGRSLEAGAMGAVGGHLSPPRSDGGVGRRQGGNEEGGSGEEAGAGASNSGGFGSAGYGGSGSPAGGSSRRGSKQTSENVRSAEGPWRRGTSFAAAAAPMEEDLDAQMDEEDNDENKGNENAAARPGPGPSGAVSAAPSQELSIGHAESEKENFGGGGALSTAKRQALGGSALHRMPLTSQQRALQQLNTPPDSAMGHHPDGFGGIQEDRRGGRTLAAAFAAAATGVGAAAGTPQHHRTGGENRGGGYGGATMADDDMDIDGSAGAEGNAVYGAEHGSSLADAMNLDIAAGPPISDAIVHGASAASAPRSAQYMAAAAPNVGAPGLLPPLAATPPPLPSRSQSQQEPMQSGMQTRSRTRLQRSASLQQQQRQQQPEHDAAAIAMAEEVAATPLGGRVDNDMSAMSHSEGLGLGSMMRRNYRLRTIDDADDCHTMDRIEEGNEDGDEGGGEGGVASSGHRAAAGRGPHRQGSWHGRTPLGAQRPDSGESGSHPRCTRATGNINISNELEPRTGLHSSSDLVTGSGSSRERDDSLSTRTLLAFDVLARAMAAAAVAAAVNGGSQIVDAPEADNMLPVGLDLLRRPFEHDVPSSHNHRDHHHHQQQQQQPPSQHCDPTVRKLYELDEEAEEAAAAVQHPTQLRDDGTGAVPDPDLDLDTQRRGPVGIHEVNLATRALPTQLRTVAGEGASQQVMPPWREVLFSGAGGGAAGSSQASGCPAGAVRLSELTGSRRRMDAARCFYDMLVLKSRGLVDLQAEGPSRAPHHHAAEARTADTGGNQAAAAAPAGMSAGGAVGVAPEQEVIPDVWVALTQRGVAAASARLLPRLASS